MAAALEAAEGDETTVGEAAFHWLQGEPGILNRGDLHELRLERMRKADRRTFGRNLLLSLVKFLPQAGVHGLVLLLDEVETLSQVSGIPSFSLEVNRTSPFLDRRFFPARRCKMLPVRVIY